jgi:hypothetical protein
MREKTIVNEPHPKSTRHDDAPQQETVLESFLSGAIQRLNISASAYYSVPTLNPDPKSDSRLELHWSL